MRDLSDFIAGFLKYTDNTEPPRLFREWTAVGCIAAALQRKCWFQFDEDLIFYPNFYIVLVGPPGKARKGTAMKPGQRLLRKLGVKLSSEATTRESLIRELNESGQSEITTDGEILTHSSLTVFSKELTVFLGYNNTQLIMDLTDWYDCDSHWTYRTKGQGTDEINGVWVNIIGATTPELIQSSLPRDAIGGGLASRMIFVYEPDKEKMVPLPFKSAQEKTLNEQLEHDLEDIHTMQGQFQVSNESPGFLDTYAKWYVEQHDKPPFKDPNLDGYMERRPTHLLKLAQVMAASESSDLFLRRKHLERAADLLHRTELRMGRTFAGYGSGRAAAVQVRIMDHIAQQGQVTEQELSQLFYADLEGYRQLQDIVLQLRKQGFVKEIIKGAETLYVFQPNTPFAQKWVLRNKKP